MRRNFLSLFMVAFVTLSMSARSQMLLAQGLVFDTPGPHVVSSLRVTSQGSLTGLKASVDANVIVPSHASISVSKASIGGLFGIHAADRSHVIVQASTDPHQISLSESSIGNAIGLFATEEGTIEYAGSLSLTSQTNGDAFFSLARDAAQLTISGNADINQFGNGSAFGTAASGTAEVLLGGHIAITDNGNGSAFGTTASGFVEVSLAGNITITDNGNGNAVLVAANEHSNVTIIGSGIIEEFGNGNSIGILSSDSSIIDFSGDYQLKETGNGDVLFVNATGDSHIRMAGNLTAENSGNSSEMSHINLRDASRLDFVAGRLQSSYVRRDNVIDDPIIVQLTDTAKMYWSGGVLGPSTIPSFNLDGLSTLVIVGSAFDSDSGYIEDLSGRISGILADGSPFVFDFERSVDAKIILVPEPSSLGYALITLVFGLARRRQLVAFGNLGFVQTNLPKPLSPSGSRLVMGSP